MAEQWIRENLASEKAAQTVSVQQEARPPAFSMIEHDSANWLEDFHRWILDRCLYRARCFGGVGALHRDFCEWASEHQFVPCTRRTFERLLSDQGFLLAEGLVSGLFLRADYEAVGAFNAGRP